MCGKDQELALVLKRIQLEHAQLELPCVFEKFRVPKPSLGNRRWNAGVYISTIYEFFAADFRIIQALAETSHEGDDACFRAGNTKTCSSQN